MVPRITVFCGLWQQGHKQYFRYLLLSRKVGRFLHKSLQWPYNYEMFFSLNYFEHRPALVTAKFVKFYIIDDVIAILPKSSAPKNFGKNLSP